MLPIRLPELSSHRESKLIVDYLHMISLSLSCIEDSLNCSLTAHVKNLSATPFLPNHDKQSSVFYRRPCTVLSICNVHIVLQVTALIRSAFERSRKIKYYTKDPLTTYSVKNNVHEDTNSKNQTGNQSFSFRMSCRAIWLGYYSTVS